jgi:MICOS complex subunit MIC60
VLALQERDFHRRFPNATRHSNRLTPTSPREEANRVTIPSKSGLSWKVSEDHNPDHELQPKGRHMNATDANKPNPVDKVIKETKPSAKSVEKPAPVPVPADKPKPTPLKKEEAKPAPPKDDRPPAIQATAMIDPLKIDQADEPVVQDLVKIVNDIITVINADNASGKYAQPIGKAKDELAKVGQRIIEMKNSEQAAAQAKITEAQGKFDESAKELLRRIDEARMEEAASFREEFEAEREKISQSYAEKVKTELERSNAVAEQRLRNELLEQAIEMKRKFVSEVESLVEKERDGRLGKLTELQSNVAGLEKMASDWNGIIDSNLQTQQLQVAVDAVRSTLSRADIPRPFVRELAALKEIANDDPVVNAAIASINPTAYQRGIPTSAQLVDRFRRVASEVRKASLLPEDAGIASHAASLVLSKVLFKKSGLAQGEDVESILTRTETLLEEGDLDGAAREMNTLSGWAKTLSRDWLGDVRKVLEVKQALEVRNALSPSPDCELMFEIGY